MGRLIEETELEKYIMHDGCEKGCGYIDERDLKYIPTVEAIPKADYEARLKADMVAMLTEIQLKILELKSYESSDGQDLVMLADIGILFQQKIGKLKRGAE